MTGAKVTFVAKFTSLVEVPKTYGFAFLEREVKATFTLGRPTHFN